MTWVAAQRSSFGHMRRSASSWTAVSIPCSPRNRQRGGPGRATNMSALRATGDRGHDHELRIRGLTAVEHRAFVSTRADASFLQYPSWAPVKDQWASEMVGRHGDSGELTGAAPVLCRQFPGTHKYFAYLPRGPVADWADPGLDRWLRPPVAHLRKSEPSPYGSAPHRRTAAGTPSVSKPPPAPAARSATYSRPRWIRSVRPSPIGSGPAAGAVAAATGERTPTRSRATSSKCRSPDGPPTSYGRGSTRSGAAMSAEGRGADRHRRRGRTP